MRHITLIAGARPNFMKIAPLIHAIQEAQSEGKDIHYRLVHTGQHYDHQMSETFFEELNIPKPDVNLGCGGGTQAEQTAAIMVAFEKDLMEKIYQSEPIFGYKSDAYFIDIGIPDDYARAQREMIHI